MNQTHVNPHIRQWCTAMLCESCGRVTLGRFGGGGYSTGTREHTRLNTRVACKVDMYV